MLIAKLDTLEIGTPSGLYPQTSFSEFGPNQQWLDENRCQIVREPPYDSATQRLTDCSPYVDSTGAIFRHLVVTLTSDEIAELGLSNYELFQMLSLTETSEEITNE
jgi:hypothetical protein